MKIDTLDLIINKYYDREMSIEEEINLEKRQINSKYIKEYTKKQWFKFYKISSSIKRTTNILKNKSNSIVDNFIEKIQG